MRRPAEFLFSLWKGDRRPRGQAVVLLVLGIVVLLAFVGLGLDLAQYLIMRARLRRAVDAAAMAAAARFRGQYSSPEEMKGRMEQVAREALVLNGFHADSLNIITSIDTENGTPLCNDPEEDIHHTPERYICFPVGRKKVWVEATASFPTAFIRLVGVPRISVTADAVGEAASLDLVLALDISLSMTYEGGTARQIDPTECSLHPSTWNGSEAILNSDGCYPFEYVRAAAMNFVSKILDMDCANPSDPNQCLEQDRVAIVLFSTGWGNAPESFRGTFFLTHNRSHWFRRQEDAIDALENIKVYQPAEICKTWWDSGHPDEPGVCLCYGPSCSETPEPDHSNYQGLPGSPDRGTPCMMRVNHPDDPDISTCLTTDIGDALKLAGQLFHDEGRRDALWVTVLLTDGAATATGPAGDDDPAHPLEYLPFGYCPSDDQDTKCRDTNTGGPGSRHPQSDVAHYDADDYARDQADYVACPPDNPPSECATPGQGAFIFAIGMGQEVLDTSLSDPGDPPAGAALLRYIANVGEDNDPTTDLLCDNVPYDQDCGNYYYRASGSEIGEVFEDIAQRIFTRLSH